MKEKFRILKTMAVVYKIMAWVTLVFGLIASVTFLVQFSLLSQQLGTAVPAFAGFSLFVVFMAYTLLGFGTLYALAEGIHLLLSIEQQTKTTQDKVREIRPAA